MAIWKPAVDMAFSLIERGFVKKTRRRYHGPPSDNNAHAQLQDEAHPQAIVIIDNDVQVDLSVSWLRQTYIYNCYKEIQ